MPEEVSAVEGGQPLEVPAGTPETPGSPTAGVESKVETTPESAQERAAERYAAMLSQVQGSGAPKPVADDAQLEVDAKEIYAETDSESRVKKLIALSDAKGPVYAIQVAQKLNDFFVLDRTHDELAKRFHEEMTAQGKI